MKYILISIFFGIYTSTFAQIGGLSGTKLSSLNSGVLHNKSIEFEPGFFHSRTSKYWDGNSSLHSIYSTTDSLNIITGMYFRFTYGLMDKLELGVSISNDMSMSQFGIKIPIINKEKYGISIISGANIPLGNTSIDTKLRTSSYHTSYGLGIVSSIYSTDKLSFDMSAQYMRFITDSWQQNKGGYYLNFDMGYYVFNKQLMLIAAAAYSHFEIHNTNHEVLTLIPGISVETGKNYGFSLSFPMDIYGRRENKNSAVNFILTLSFD